MPEKQAIRKLMGAIAGARSLRDVYDAALHCLQETLRVERASMLLLDEHQRMRFVAWSGLSSTYRRAVEGPSPWENEAEAEVVLVEDVRESEAFRELLPVLAAERIAAAAWVPLRFGPKLIGKFDLYYESPHVFSPDEITIAEIAAGHVAFAIEHRRIAAELENRLDSERDARREAEREARLRQQSEGRLRLAMSAGSMGAWEWDVETGRVEWSEELARVHGVESDGFGGTFESVQQHIHPDDRQRFRDGIARALENAENEFEIEYRIVPPSGAQRWVAAKGRTVADERGRPSRMVGICRDISERKRAEQTQSFLAEAGRILATTLEPDSAVRQLARIVVPYLADWCAISVVDEQGLPAPVEVAHRDPALVDLGWRVARRMRWRSRAEGSVGEVLETGRSKLIPELTPEMIGAAAEDEEHRAMLMQLGMRSVITVPLQARGGVLGVLSLGTAGSGRIFATEDLRAAEDIASWAALALDNAKLLGEAESAWSVAEKSRRQLQTLAEISAELASELDPGSALRKLARKIVEQLADYCITYSCDGRLVARQGLAHSVPSKAEVVRRLADLGPPSLEDAEGTGAVIRTGQPMLFSDVTDETIAQTALSPEHERAVRELAPRSAMIVPLKSRGHAVGAIVFATTEDSGRHYDSQDLELALELASRAALLVDNARLYAEATAAVSARDDMIQLVSHDLRNPLQSISTAAALLQLDAPPERRAKGLETITLATSQMNRLLQDLLDISQMDVGRFSVTPEEVDAASLIEETHTLFAPVAEKKGIQLRVRVPKEPALLQADPSRIMQVLSNFVGNALKFVPAGGEITLSADVDRERVRIAVSDTGVGLSLDDQGRVFERFWRGDRRKERGAGLGLAVAKGIVEAHGGEIGVDSVEGRGSTFYFVLDAARPAPVQGEPASSRDAPILVVDDDDAFREEIVDLLRAQGYPVAAARDGKEALTFLRGRRRPSLVLLDIMMPVMDGWALLDAVKLDTQLASVPLVLLTGLGELQSYDPIEHADGYLEKPVRLGELLALAEKHCRGHRAGPGPVTPAH
jgi:PAS domain S-box-containing protein